MCFHASISLFFTILHHVLVRLSKFFVRRNRVLVMDWKPLLKSNEWCKYFVSEKTSIKNLKIYVFFVESTWCNLRDGKFQTLIFFIFNKKPNSRSLYLAIRHFNVTIKIQRMNMNKKKPFCKLNSFWIFFSNKTEEKKNLLSNPKMKDNSNETLNLLQYSCAGTNLMQKLFSDDE
jgi:hypothetical protein